MMNLDELKALHAAATEGNWIKWFEASHNAFPKLVELIESQQSEIERLKKQLLDSETPLGGMTAKALQREGQY